MEVSPLSGGIDERRAVMAKNHNLLVNALAKEIGVVEAVKKGRDALFKMGLSIGEDVRFRLGVRDSVEDLILAARILYKVLGISFVVRERKDNALEIEIDRCALSQYYSELTCEVLSAADEGVVMGLNSKIRMEFKRRMTAGFPSCIACVSCVKGREN